MALVAGLLITGAAGTIGAASDTAGAAQVASASSASSASSTIFPTVTGSYGQTPKITFPKGEKAPKKLEVKVLHQGTGPVTKKGDLLVANYIGQIWGGKVFDSSFSRKELSGFGIGIEQVIPGWDKTLVGVHAGSRLLLVVPPVDGYGTSGNSAAGIKGTDTLVFVVDVVTSYNKSVEAPSNATPVTSSVGGVAVSGAVGKPPTIKVAKGAKKPTADKLTVLARGHGKPITAGLVVAQLEVVNWSNAVQESTWTAGTPYGANVDIASDPTVFDSLKGVPLGSRVLIDLPADEGEGPYAAVVDVISEPSDPQS
jgi:peptidylprolyl isomerase